MNWVFKFMQSSIGAKVIMGVTGIALCGFVLAHMIGNLQVFLGPDTLNAYGAFLKEKPALLWTMRIGLIVAAVLHIWSGFRLTRLNQQARPVAYAQRNWRKASLASRTMIWTAIVVLAFVIYHLLHFTFGVTDPEHARLVDAQGRHDIYAMVVFGFQNAAVAISYIVANILLGFHLSHGASSMFQSLGWNHPRYNALLQKIGPVFAAIIVIGNVSMPLAVLLGWVGLEGGL